MGTPPVYEGKTLEDAVKKGLQALGLSRAEAMITVIEEGTGGFLGFGARPYRVRIMARPGGPIREPEDRRPREGRERDRDRDRGDRGRRGRRGRDDRPRAEGRGGEGRGGEGRGRESMAVVEGRGRDDRGRGRDDRPAGRDERGGRDDRGGREDRGRGREPMAASGERRPDRDDRRRGDRRDLPRDEERRDLPRGEDRRYGERRDTRHGEPRVQGERPMGRPDSAPPDRPREMAPAGSMGGPPGPQEGRDDDGGRRRRRRGRRGGRGRGGREMTPGAQPVGEPQPFAAVAEVYDEPSMSQPSMPDVPAAEADFGERPIERTAEPGMERPMERHAERPMERQAGRPMEHAAAPPVMAAPRAHATPTTPALTNEALAAEGKRWTEELLRAMGFEARVTAVAEQDRVDVTAEVSQDDELLTGPKGEVRQALQHLLNRMVNRGEGTRYHLQLEINDFWKRREDELRALAGRLAEEAVSTGGEVVTEYLNAQERRIVHVTLRDDARVKTYALGDGMIKRLAVAPADFPEGPRADD